MGRPAAIRLTAAGALLGLFGLLACAAAPPGAAWRASHPGYERQPPKRGDAIGPVVASLGEHEPAVGVGSLRWLEITSTPWRRLEPGWWERAPAEPGALHALIVERDCRAPGWRGPRVRRASWLLFESGSLAAFDHWEFDAACQPRHRFEPTSEALKDRERELIRELSRSFPESALGPEATFRKGLAYLAHDRLEEATNMLSVGERSLAARERHARENGVEPDASLVEARNQARELRNGLRKARGLDVDPSEQFWKGQ